MTEYENSMMKLGRHVPINNKIYVLDWLINNKGFQVDSKMLIKAICSATISQEVILSLIPKSIDIDNQNEHGLTALHCAVQRDSYDIVSRLLYFGADPNIKTKSGYLPEKVGHYSDAKNYDKIVKLLEEYRKKK